jgi:hypothetical protein
MWGKEWLEGKVQVIKIMLKVVDCVLNLASQILVVNGLVLHTTTLHCTNEKENQRFTRVRGSSQATKLPKL